MKILDAVQVREIFLKRMDGASLRDIAREFGISRQYVLNILNRSAYGEVEVPESLVSVVSYHVPLRKAKTEKRNRKIVQLYKDGFTQAEIARKLGCGTATVCRTLQAEKNS